MNYTDYISILHSLFEKSFVGAYRDADKNKRRKILPYLHAVHRRWYYSTLVEYAPFSPANLTGCISAYFEEPADTYIVPVLRTPTKFSGINFRTVSYSLENHPVVADFRALINFCTPYIDLHQSSCLTDPQALEAAELLSLNDPHYASFLLELALRMRLLKGCPSLYVQRMEPSKKCDELFALSNEDILREIVDATIKMTVYNMQNESPLPENIFTESFIRSLLANPLETDELFQRVFDAAGYDFDAFAEIGNNPPGGLSDIPPELLGIDMEMLSGAFFMGIVLDRYFYTPFGHFLRIIRPLYALPFALAEELQAYVVVGGDPDEAFIAFFAPCSSYSLTDLGLKILNVKKTDSNYFNAADMNFENMKDTIFASEYAIEKFVEIAAIFSPVTSGGGLPDKIYTFRTRLGSDSSVWAHVQVPDTFTLEELYDTLTGWFDLKNNGEYSFFHDKVENRFAEYPSSKRGAKTKTTKKPAELFTLAELDFEHMQTMILAAYGQSAIFSGEPPVVRLTLERLTSKDPDPDDLYPCISRASKKMQEVLNNSSD